MNIRLVWPAGRPFTRAHSHAFGSTEFYARPDVDTRFSPARVDEAIAPVLYAGGDDRTAAAETIFRRLPDRGRPRRVWLDRYRTWHWSHIYAGRDLLLLPVDARMPDAEMLVDGDASRYPTARAGAGELLREHDDVDGLIWVSRQLHDCPSTALVEVDMREACVLLVGAVPGRPGGVSRDELTTGQPVVPLATAAGLERLDAIAEELDVTVVRT